MFKVYWYCLIFTEFYICCVCLILFGQIFILSSWNKILVCYLICALYESTDLHPPHTKPFLFARKCWCLNIGVVEENFGNILNINKPNIELCWKAMELTARKIKSCNLLSLIMCFIHMPLCTPCSSNQMRNNLAFGKPAFQSTTWEANSAARVVDGDRSPRYCSHITGTNHPPWFVVDLGFVSSVTEVSVFSGGTGRRGEHFSPLCGWVGSLFWVVWTWNIHVCWLPGGTLRYFVANVGLVFGGVYDKSSFKVCSHAPAKVGMTRLSCPRPIRGRYVAVTSSHGVMVLCEVEVYTGKSASGLSEFEYIFLLWLVWLCVKNNSFEQSTLSTFVSSGFLNFDRSCG